MNPLIEIPNIATQHLSATLLSTEEPSEIFFTKGKDLLLPHLNNHCLSINLEAIFYNIVLKLIKVEAKF